MKKTNLSTLIILAIFISIIACKDNKNTKEGILKDLGIHHIADSTINEINNITDQANDAVDNIKNITDKSVKDVVNNTVNKAVKDSENIINQVRNAIKDIDSKQKESKKEEEKHTSSQK